MIRPNPKHDDCILIKSYELANKIIQAGYLDQLAEVVHPRNGATWWSFAPDEGIQAMKDEYMEQRRHRQYLDGQEQKKIVADILTFLQTEEGQEYVLKNAPRPELHLSEAEAEFMAAIQAIKKK